MIIFIVFKRVIIKLIKVCYLVFQSKIEWLDDESDSITKAKELFDSQSLKMFQYILKVIFAFISSHDVTIKPEFNTS